MKELTKTALELSNRLGEFVSLNPKLNLSEKGTIYLAIETMQKMAETLDNIQETQENILRILSEKS